MLLAGGAQAEVSSCASLGRSPWPLTTAGRSELLQRLEDRREACVENAEFLALLGALHLELGQPAQALIWLERALLLRPDAKGAQVDHALALSALGEDAAARQLYDSWLGRSDIPPVVLQRLRSAIRQGEPPLPTTAQQLRKGEVGGFRWSLSGGLAGGHETNLDRSPSLSEIRLTPPEGPITLPLAVPIAPKKGSARLGEAALQGHYATAADVLWQAGLAVNERRAKASLEADQRSFQLVLARSHQIGAAVVDENAWIPAWLNTAWRIQSQVAWGRAEGSVANSHHQWRYALSAESDWRLGPGQCVRRVDFEIGRQRYPGQSVLDSVMPSLLLGADCQRLNGVRWAWGLHARLGWDRPLSIERPGGRQTQLSVGARVGFEWRERWISELSVRVADLQDREGFSPLLANGAPRVQSQTWWTWEGAYRLSGDKGRSTELWLQWQRLRQSSNIELFGYNARSLYAGLRWRL